VSVTDDDGNVETQLITLTVNQVNDPATFGGNTSGVGDEDAGPIAGALTVSDAVDGMSAPNFRTLTVNSVNDPPVVPSEAFSVNENAVPGTVVGTVTASDVEAESFTKMYWADLANAKIQRANLDGSGVEDVIASVLTGPVDIFVDNVGGKMYWGDVGAGKIQRANLDGSNIEDLVTGIPDVRGIAVDLAGGKIYWTDDSADKIQRANLDGSGVEDLITSGIDGLRGITLDVAAGKMYWTDWIGSKIQRANLDGSGVEDVVTGLVDPRGVTLDVAAGKIYWADTVANKIQRSNLDGTVVEDLVSSGLSGPLGITLDLIAGKMYWSDDGNDKISRANLDGSGVEDLVTTGLDVPVGMTLGDPIQTLSYAITTGNTGGAFSIDPATGEITVASSAALDFETTPSFTLTVEVTDSGGLTTSGTVTVNLNDLNDAPVATDDPGGDFNATITALTPQSYWRLGELAPGPLVDVGTSGNHAINNGALLDEVGALLGDSNTAVHFSGSQYIEIPHSNDYLLDNGSVQLWFNVDSIGGVQTLLSKEHTAFGTGGHLTMTIESDGRLQTRLQSTTVSETVGSPGTVAAGQWHHVVFTFGSQGMTLYLDGQLVGTNTYTGGLGTTSGGSGNSEPIAIGAGTTGSNVGSVTPLNNFYSGLIDEVAIFATELNADQIGGLYATGIQSYAAVDDTVLNVSAAYGVLANDSDADGDPLTAVLVSGPFNASAFTLNTDGSFSYTPNSGFGGSDSFTYVATDGAGNSNIATATITVTLVNDAPVNSVPVAQLTDEDTPLVFSNSIGNLISIGDTDAGVSPVQVTLTAANGTLTLPDTAGLTFTLGDGASDGSMVFTGTITAINAALDGLSFAPTPDYNGAASVQIITEDLGNTGAGGSLSDADTVAITVNPVSDTPVATDDPGDFNATITPLAPQSYWRLGELADPLVDVGASGNDAINSGALLDQPGALGGDSNTAVRFNGGEHIEIPHSSDYLLDNGSVQLWFNADSIGAVQTLLSKDHTGFGTGGHLTMTIEIDGSLQTRLQSTTGDAVVNSTSAVTAGQWHHVAFTFGSRGMALYLDGQLVDTDTYNGGLGTTSGGSGNSEPIAIGAGTAGSGAGSVTPLDSFYTGLIDEVAIFATELDADQIGDLYAAGVQNYTIAEDTTLNVGAAQGVLANDFHADGGPLTAVWVSDPSNASSFTLNPDGSFSYTPLANFNGTDSFTYRATDGVTPSNTATVTITVAAQSDDPIVTAATPAQNSVDSEIISLDVAGAFTDPDGDTLTYSATGLPPGLSIDTASGVISGTIAANASLTGAYSVAVSADDGQGGTVTDSFAWTVTNPAPIVSTPTSDQSSVDSETISLNVAAAFTDPDGDTLTYTATDLPPGLSIDTASGVISGTIAANASLGVYSVAVTANDGQGGTVSDTFTWTVTNPAPSVTAATPAQSSADGAALPPGLSIDTVSGVISGTIAPNASLTGAYSVAVSANDGQGGTVSDRAASTAPPSACPSPAPSPIPMATPSPTVPRACPRVSASTPSPASSAAPLPATHPSAPTTSPSPPTTARVAR
jgi:hypothetical protein